jgi:N6-L-threonylcarbamoyladenine synthase
LKLLAIETSCDETAAAVVENGRSVLSNELYSQIEIHRKYGGVVPEIASRNHVQKLPYIVADALAGAQCRLDEMDALAVTYGPGLVGALLTGVAYAKALAYYIKKPLIPVNHIEGHICANYITHPALQPPFICLVVSGGHTHIVQVEDEQNYTLLGRTRDDAAGEAFDKVARVLGLPYPGGPALEALAAKGDGHRYAFPRGFKNEKHLDFTFSGVKTAVINMLHTMQMKDEAYNSADVAASFQSAVVEVLKENTFEAARRTGLKKIALAGGVSANQALRGAFAEKAQKEGVKLFLPDLKYCTDNAAMIACAGYYRFMAGETAELTLNACPSLELF